MVRILCVISLSLALWQTVNAELKPWEDPWAWIQEHEKGGRFSEMKNEAMVVRLEEIRVDPDLYDGELLREYESLLVELSTRRRNDWLAYLTGCIQKIRDKGEKAGGFEQMLYTRDLEPLTVLRRLEGKPQPLSIELAPLLKKVYVFPELPELAVTACRHAKEKEDFWFTQGGNYRSGRQSRWTVLLWNEKGDPIPRRSRMGIIGGGMFNRNKISDDQWQTQIKMASYIEGSLQPGRYHGCLAYHDEASIADEEQLGGYVLSFSPPFEFQVGPRAVDPPVVARDEIRKWVHALPKEGRVTVIRANYGNRFHESVELASPAGKLLQEGWPVVPEIIHSLADPELTETQRAWAFGLLYSITSCKDPTQRAGVMGSYRKETNGFWTETKINGEFAGGGGGLGGGFETASGGKIDPAEQRKFLKEWQELVKQLVRVEGVPGNTE